MSTKQKQNINMNAEAAAATVKSAPERRKGQYYHPSVWGDFFLTHVFESDQMVSGWNEEIQVLKSEVKMMLVEETKSAKRLDLVDTIQRLGISYHFEPEIEQLVQQEIDEINPSANDDGLHKVALRFRILRQHGHNARPGEFEKFKDEAGETFRKELIDDIEGMLSLYEAAHMRTHGETILDEAMDFTKTHLMAARIDDDSSPLAERVARALERPLRKDMDRIQHLFFIPNYEKTEGHNRSILKLAKLSYNLLQHMYQQELKVLTKWWTELEFASKVRYARDKLVETYYWALGMFWEPKFALARYLVTKGTTLGTVLDDTYDIYGRFEELELLTSKFARWDSVSDDLDISLKYVYEAVMDFNHEIRTITSEEGRPYCFEYAKRALNIDMKAYLEEQRWYEEGVVPSLEEYRKLSAVSTYYLTIMTSALSGMGDLASEEVFDWVMSEPDILFASGDQCRLMDDIVTHQVEQERGHFDSAVQIYMKQYGATKEEAISVLNSMIDDDWRVMNREMLNLPTLADGRPVPKEVGILLVRMGQIMEVIYKEIDGYSCSDTFTMANITALFVTPLHL
ncbi:Probable terpene synthase 3 [Linum grandiflorum]